MVKNSCTQKQAALDLRTEDHTSAPETGRDQARQKPSLIWSCNPRSLSVRVGEESQLRQKRPLVKMQEGRVRLQE